MLILVPENAIVILDTPARFRVPLVMINTLLKMTENF